MPGQERATPEDGAGAPRAAGQLSGKHQVDEARLSPRDPVQRSLRPDHEGGGVELGASARGDAGKAGAWATES
eukprot:9487033-Pyramimonas_sp.AAC.1